MTAKNVFDDVGARTRRAPEEFCELEFENPSISLLLQGEELTIDQMQGICGGAKTLFDSQSNLLRVESPITVVGDVHADFDDLMLIFRLGGFPSPENRYLFLGDYVDRGNASVRVIMLIFALAVEFPRSVFCLRGNHECVQVAEIYGLLDELHQTFGEESGDARTAFDAIMETCFYLPLACVVNNRFFCVHAGISENLTLDAIEELDRKMDVPKVGLVTDLLWSDPSDEAGFTESPRGAGHCFGADATDAFLDLTGMEMIIRSHQLVQEGYKFTHNDAVLTLFSSSNYCGKCGNVGAFLVVDKSGDELRFVRYADGEKLTD